MRDHHARPESEPGDAVLGPGAKLGRYTVLSALGDGVMARVYAAYDSELDRKVALKVFFHEVWAQHTEVLRELILREAKALARLSHPNVVAVFEVGTADGELFIAMEYVEGRTLTEWLAEEERSWESIVRVLTEAGTGLAAAHDAGLVHRDFKPDNVLVGTDGRVRVTDFGLARVDVECPRARAESEAEVAELAAATSADGARGKRRRGRLSESGMIMGTPDYMSPEQHRGKSADARSDIYSFSVVLYRALYRRKPFSGKSLSELRGQVLAGEPAPVPKDIRVPAKVRDVIRRGMSVKAEDRIQSMGEVLGLLGAMVSSGSRDWRVWLALALGVAGVGVGLVLALSWGSSEPCRGGSARMEATWSPGHRDAVRTAFAATEAPFADRALDSVLVSLDRYADEWVAMYRQVCEATHVRGEQSVALLDLRMQCLDRQRARFGATIVALEHADLETVSRAVEVGGSLADVDDCDDVDALTAAIAPPADRRARETLARARSRLADATAKIELGKYAAGLPIALGVADEARRADYKPLEAEALLTAGRALWRMGRLHESADVLARSAVAAEAGRHDRIKVKAWIELVYVTGYELGNPVRAGFWRDLAVGGVYRLGMSPPLLAKLKTSWASTLFRAGRIAESLKEQQLALEISIKQFGANHASVGKGLSDIGTSYLLLGDTDKALDHARRGLAIRRKALGDQHPDVAESINNLGNVLAEMGKLEEAEEHYARARDQWIKTFGPKHPRIAVSLTNLAGIAARKGDLDEAVRLVEQAFAIEKAALGENHLSVAASHGNLGNLYAARGELESAEHHYRKALEITERAVGSQHPQMASVLTALGSNLSEQGRRDEAVVALTRARSVWKQLGGPAASQAETAFALARALAGDKARRAEAVDSADNALRLYTEAGPAHADEHAAVAEWLAAQR